MTAADRAGDVESACDFGVVSLVQCSNVPSQIDRCASQSQPIKRCHRKVFSSSLWSSGPVQSRTLAGSRGQGEKVHRQSLQRPTKEWVVSRHSGGQWVRRGAVRCCAVLGVGVELSVVAAIFGFEVRSKENP